MTGMLRNNVGYWEVRSVDPPKGARGFELYSVKDTQMAKDASYGLMLWDGKSRGTLENMRNLLVHGKPVTVHFAPAQRFVSLRSTKDLHKLGIASLSDHGGSVCSRSVLWKVLPNKPLQLTTAGLRTPVSLSRRGSAYPAGTTAAER